MNELEFTFDATPWEEAGLELKAGDLLSAAQFLALMEGEDETYLEEVLQGLEQKRVMLDISDLQKASGSGEAAIRLRREEQLVHGGNLPGGLEENDPLRLYMEEVAELPHALETECDREKLTSGNLYRVVELAKEQVGKGVLLLDLIQEGSLGLWQAVQNWNGEPFEPYRDWWIKSYMARLITMQARSNGMGQRMRQAMEDYRGVDERLLAELGRNPTLEEIAQELHMSADEADAVRRTLENARMLNRTKPTPEPEEEDPDEQQAVEDTAYFQSRQRVLDMLSGLSEGDAKLLSLRFGLEGGLPLSPEEAGKKLGLTAEEVVAREAAALAQLRGDR